MVSDCLCLFLSSFWFLFLVLGPKVDQTGVWGGGGGQQGWPLCLPSSDKATWQWRNIAWWGVRKLTNIHGVLEWAQSRPPHRGTENVNNPPEVTQMVTAELRQELMAFSPDSRFYFILCLLSSRKLMTGEHSPWGRCCTAFRRHQDPPLGQSHPAPSPLSPSGMCPPRASSSPLPITDMFSYEQSLVQQNHEQASCSTEHQTNLRQKRQQLEAWGPCAFHSLSPSLPFVSSSWQVAFSPPQVAFLGHISEFLMNTLISLGCLLLLKPQLLLLPFPCWTNSYRVSAVLRVGVYPVFLGLLFIFPPEPPLSAPAPHSLNKEFGVLFICFIRILNFHLVYWFILKLAAHGLGQGMNAVPAQGTMWPPSGPLCISSELLDPRYPMV